MFNQLASDVLKNLLFFCCFLLLKSPAITINFQFTCRFCFFFHNPKLSKFSLIWPAWLLVPRFVRSNSIFCDSEGSWPWLAINDQVMAQVHPARWGRESEEQKQEKLLGQDEDSWIKMKTVKMKDSLHVWTSSDTKAVTHHLPQAVGCPASL